MFSVRCTEITGVKCKTVIAGDDKEYVVERFQNHALGTHQRDVSVAELEAYWNPAPAPKPEPKPAPKPAPKKVTKKATKKTKKTIFRRRRK